MTAQMPDMIVIEGVDHALFSEPLEAYYQLERRPHFIPLHTANWRGYVASWEVRDGRLYLTKIAAKVCEVAMAWNCPQDQQRKVELVDLFPASAAEPVFADWFSGTLRVPLGALLENRHMGYESVYEFDLMLSVEKGRVVSTSARDNRTTIGPATKSP